MKILLVHIFFSNEYSSGVNPIVFGTFETLKKQGHNIYIFAENIKPFIDENYEYSQYFPESNLLWKGDINWKTELKYYTNSLYNIEAQNKLGKMLDNIKPDLVHIHTTWDMSFSILKPIKDRKIPVIYTAHDISLFCPASFYIGLNYCNDCKGLNTLPCTFKKCVKGIGWRSAYFTFKAFVERFIGAHRNISKYIAVSQAEKDYIKTIGINENKITVLSNFIDKSLAEISIPDYSKDTKYFLYAGGVSAAKGIYTLLDTIKQIPKEIEFHIAGGGKYETIENFVQDNNLTNIKILDLITQKQMQEEYKNCIAVIMPSEIFETFGMVNIEAAIYGKPSISSNIGGLPDVVEDGKTGQIFEPKNVKQLKECILKYWNNRDLAIEHGKNAREKALTQYNEDLYFEKLMKIYEEVLENAKR